MFSNKNQGESLINKWKKRNVINIEWRGRTKKRRGNVVLPCNTNVWNSSTIVCIV